MDKALEDNAQVWAWSKWLQKNAENIEQMNATAELLKDAPLLLAEVERLREAIEYAIVHAENHDVIRVLDEVMEND